MSWDAFIERWPQLLYLLMALLLVAGAASGFARLRADRAHIIPALLFWGGAIVLIVFLYSAFGQPD
jgi:hypothetical protein